MRNPNYSVVYGKELELRESDPFCPRFEPQSKERLIQINPNECIREILSTHHIYHTATDYEEGDPIYLYVDNEWNKVIFIRRVHFEDEVRLNYSVKASNEQIVTPKASDEKVETPKKKSKLKTFRKFARLFACCLWETVQIICCCHETEEIVVFDRRIRNEPSDESEHILHINDLMDESDVLKTRLEYDMEGLICDFIDKAVQLADSKLGSSSSDDSFGTPILAIDNLENSDSDDKKVPYLETHF